MTKTPHHRARETGLEFPDTVRDFLLAVGCLFQAVLELEDLLVEFRALVNHFPQHLDQLVVLDLVVRSPDPGR